MENELTDKQRAILAELKNRDITPKQKAIIAELEKRDSSAKPPIDALSFAPDVGQFVGGLAYSPLAVAGQAIGIPAPATLAAGEGAGRAGGKFIEQLVRRPDPEAFAPAVTDPLATISPAIPFIERLGRGLATRTPEERKELAVQGAIGAGTSLGGQALFKGAKEAIKFIPQVVSRLAQGVPMDVSKILVDNPEKVFNIKAIKESKELLTQATTKTLEGIKQGRKILGERVASVEDAIVSKLGGKEVVPLGEFNSVLSRKLKREGVARSVVEMSGAKIASLGKEEQKLIREVTNLTGGVEKLTLDDAIRLRRRIDDILDPPSNIISTVPDRVKGILGAAQDVLRKEISKAAPRLEPVYKKFSEYASIYDDLKGMLSDRTAENNLTRVISKGTPESKLLQRLNKELPDALKFFDDLSLKIASRTFAAPVRPGFTGGIAAGAGLAAGQFANPAFYATLPALSPLATGAAVRAGSFIGGLGSKMQIPGAAKALGGRFIDRLKKE